MPQKTQQSASITQLTPATRIAIAVCLCASMALLKTLAAAGLALCVGCLLLVATRPAPRKTLSQLGAANLFVFFLWVFLPFSTPGNPAFAIGPLVATAEGLRLSLLITLKSNAIGCAFAGLVASMEATELGHGLQTLRAPATICQLLFFAMRYVHVIHEEYKRMSTATKLRCFVPRANLHTYRTVAHLCGMLLVRSWERAERVHQAMRCRGFTGTFYSLSERRLGFFDYAIFPLSLSVSAAILFLDHAAQYW